MNSGTYTYYKIEKYEKKVLHIFEFLICFKNVPQNRTCSKCSKVFWQPGELAPNC